MLPRHSKRLPIIDPKTNKEKIFDTNNLKRNGSSAIRTNSKTSKKAPTTIHNNNKINVPRNGLIAKTDQRRKVTFGLHKLPLMQKQKQKEQTNTPNKNQTESQSESQILLTIKNEKVIKNSKQNINLNTIHMNIDQKIENMTVDKENQNPNQNYLHINHNYDQHEKGKITCINESNNNGNNIGNNIGIIGSNIYNGNLKKNSNGNSMNCINNSNNIGYVDNNFQNINISGLTNNNNNNNLLNLSENNNIIPTTHTTNATTSATTIAGGINFADLNFLVNNQNINQNFQLNLTTVPQFDLNTINTINTINTLNTLNSINNVLNQTQTQLQLQSQSRINAATSADITLTNNNINNNTNNNTNITTNQNNNYTNNNNLNNIDNLNNNVCDSKTATLNFLKLKQELMDIMINDYNKKPTEHLVFRLNRNIKTIKSWIYNTDINNDNININNNNNNNNDNFNYIDKSCLSFIEFQFCVILAQIGFNWKTLKFWHRIETKVWVNTLKQMKNVFINQFNQLNKSSNLHQLTNGVDSIGINNNTNNNQEKVFKNN